MPGGRRLALFFRRCGMCCQKNHNHFLHLSLFRMFNYPSGKSLHSIFVKQTLSRKGGKNGYDRSPSFIDTCLRRTSLHLMRQEPYVANPQIEPVGCVLKEG